MKASSLPDWAAFTHELDDLYRASAACTVGNVADYWGLRGLIGGNAAKAKESNQDKTGEQIPKREVFGVGQGVGVSVDVNF